MLKFESYSPKVSARDAQRADRKQIIAHLLVERNFTRNRRHCADARAILPYSSKEQAERRKKLAVSYLHSKTTNQ